MKKILLLFLALAAFPFAASAEDQSIVYEAEKAKLTGANQIRSDVNASGWKAVGDFANEGDAVIFTITVPQDGVYDLIVSCKGIGGNKINNLLVDGQQQGQFECSSMMYSKSPVRGVLLTAGVHEVTITRSWGYIMLDSLTVTPCQAISSDVYEVSPTLINPRATEEAKKLFSYLCESYGKVTLAGQVCDKGLDGPEIRAIYDVTGKYPAIIGFDMMDYTPSRQALGARGNSVAQAVKFHEAGGIVTFCWHWGSPAQYILPGKDGNGNPRWWGAFYTENTSFDIDAVMNGRDPEGKELLDKDIEGIAQQLLLLQEKGVPVLWRPLHEASGGWFWWGAKGSTAYQQLWIYLYDQLTNVYGCNNLIWVWNGQSASWYPGDEYVDIIGEDIYAPNHAYSAQTSKFIELLDYSAANKIIALTENGVVFDIDNVVASNARWAWFNTWSGDFVLHGSSYSEAYTEADILCKAYSSEYVVTLDELPQLY